MIGKAAISDRAIGFSTGCLYRDMDTYSAEAVDIIAGQSAQAVEIMCAYVEHVKRLPSMVRMLSQFKVKTIHLPVDIRYENVREVRLMLGEINEFYRAIGASLAIIHPDLVDNWAVFNGRLMRLAVENMDNRKNGFRQPQELFELLKQHPQYQFVLDVNHCYTNDRSLSLVSEFVRDCGDRLAEIHLSGCGIDGYHKPLYLTRQSELIEKVPFGDCPIIIESPCSSLMLGSEISYIRGKLKGG